MEHGTATPRPDPPKRAEVSLHGRGGRAPRQKARSGHPTGAGTVPQGKQAALGHQIAPTEFPAGWSATTLAGNVRRRPRGWDIQPSGGGYHGPVTSAQRVDGYGPGLTPGNLFERMVANGQSSTDLNMTDWE